MPLLLTQRTAGQCSHGGSLAPLAGNPRVKLGGVPVLTVASQVAVSGCPNMVGSSPFPCVLAVYAAGATRVKVMGQPVLLDTSAPTNTPTGVTSQVTQTQQRVKGM